MLVSPQCCTLQVIMTPHVYPPSITRAVFLGDTLWQQCALAFGYLEEKGYCKGPGNCRKFPVVIGETGSFLHDDKDKQWMQVGLNVDMPSVVWRCKAQCLQVLKTDCTCLPGCLPPAGLC
jgi:hypothetical protein